MAFDDDALRAIVTARAAELGIPLVQLLREAGLNRDTFYNKSGARRIDTLEKLAAACRLPIGDLLGIKPVGAMSVDIAMTAFALAERIWTRLPQPDRTRDRLIAFFAAIYDAMAERRRNGQGIEDPEMLATWEQVLTHAWKNHSRQAAPPEIATEPKPD